MAIDLGTANTLVYVQDQGVTVRKKDQQLLVTRGQTVLETVPLGKVEQVVLMGRGVQMSTALLVDLLQRGVPVVLTNQRGSHHYATLSAGPWIDLLGADLADPAADPLPVLADADTGFGEDVRGRRGGDDHLGHVPGAANWKRYNRPHSVSPPPYN